MLIATARISSLEIEEEASPTDWKAEKAARMSFMRSMGESAATESS